MCHYMAHMRKTGTIQDIETGIRGVIWLISGDSGEVRKKRREI
jgi:hypothetical protein